MADGKTHRKWTGVGIACASAISVCAYSQGNIDIAIGSIVGAIIGHNLTCDIDVDTRTIEEQKVYDINPILGFLWQTYWMPYAKAIGHRSWLSHAPLIGTIGRLIYLFGPFLVALSYFGIYNFAYQDWMIYAFAAWCVQDLIHLALDGFWYHR